MIAEPILAFFLIWNLRKILKKTSVRPEWEKPLKLAMFAVVAIFILQVLFSLEAATLWIWHIFILLLIAAVFRTDEFRPARNIIIAFLPVFIVSMLKDIIKLLPDRVNETYGGYLNFAVPFSVIWMIVMLIIFNKQRKALEKEHKKAQDEQEQKKIIAARKAELEVLVAERTSEILQQKNELEHALTELKNTQSQLIQSEKLASLGALTAGIAHEIQNPLNFVKNFSEVNTELIEELKAERSKLKNERNEKLEDQLLNNIVDNEQKIIHHGKRADAIVKGMLQHSRISTGQKELIDINALVDEYLRLSYHGMRAKDKSFNTTLQTDFDTSIGKINIVPQDIGRVLLNLFNNAFYAVHQKNASPSSAGQLYEPTVSVCTKRIDDKIEIKVKDNGVGIPQKVVEKIFQPFFTTKPTGQGTGLGLSLSYDIVKAHGGEIKVETKEGEGSEFVIQLSLK
jgi:two-component system, NtrC family, sensor kinase